MNIFFVVWEAWELRCVVLLSLFLQLFLIFAAPLRKQTCSSWVVMPLWSAYLLAGWAANFAIGVIAWSQRNNCTISPTDKASANLLSFWAPFLLIHLGGPDAITAYSLEDNELWLRHLISLIFQAYAAAYVLYQTLPENPLLIPTVFMLISGIIKYSEQIMSLQHANLDHFRESMDKDPDPGPDYATFVDKYKSMQQAHTMTRIDEINPPRPGKPAAHKMAKKGRLGSEEAVLFAYKFFKTFKGLIVNLIVNARVRKSSRDFFLVRSPEDAFKVITIELNFMYDDLFTKASVVHTKFGYWRRSFAFGLVVVSLAIFCKKDKHSFSTSDVAITYALLYGAIASDVIAFFKLITSNWLRVYSKKLPEVHLDIDEEEAALAKKMGLLALFRKVSLFHNRRWSESIASFNLIDYCLNRRRPEREKIMDYFKLTPILNRIKYVHHKHFADDLRDRIFEELKPKAVVAEDLEMAKEMSESRGRWTLLMEEQNCGHLLPYVHRVDYDKGLLLWHIATELCWCDEEDSTYEQDPHRRFSTILSDYLLYLLVMQPTMMSTVAGIGQIRFRDTCAEAQKFLVGADKKPGPARVFVYALRSTGKFIGVFIVALFSPIICFIFSLIVAIFLPLFPPKKTDKLRNWFKQHFTKEKEEVYKRRIEERRKEACRKILGVNVEAEPGAIKGDQSNSMLFEGCRLANELMQLKDRKWVIIYRVWVEKLCYAAVRCRPNTHAQQLSKGGELITVVWLLLAHFGLGETKHQETSVIKRQGYTFYSSANA